ncbi:UNVERIFIED_CONTAM: hypothetical protein K2H54_053888 [Gekko kuhli]
MKSRAQPEKSSLAWTTIPGVCEITFKTAFAKAGLVPTGEPGRDPTDPGTQPLSDITGARIAAPLVSCSLHGFFPLAWEQVEKGQQGWGEGTAEVLAAAWGARPQDRACTPTARPTQASNRPVRQRG